MKEWKIYSIVAVALSTLLGAGYYFLFPYKSTISYTIMASIYMWIPGILGIIFVKKRGGSLKELGLRLNFNRWYLLSWLVFPFIVLLGIGINVLFPGASFSLYMTDFLESYRPILEESGQYAEMYELLQNQP